MLSRSGGFVKQQLYHAVVLQQVCFRASIRGPGCHVSVQRRPGRYRSEGRDEDSMRAVVQRVQRGQVSVAGQLVGEIGTGLVVLVGARHGDGTAQVMQLAHKIASLRIFEDDEGKMNLSALDVGAGILVIPQFTLYADCRRGRRPSFTQAARPDTAEPLIERFVEGLRQTGLAQVETGAFGTHMLVRIDNDGPVTIILDTDIL